jgi:hypothetical protein
MVKLSRLLLSAWTVISGLALVSSAALASGACPQVGFTIVEPSASSATRPVTVGKGQTLLVRREPLTATGDIVDIRLAADVSSDSNDDASLYIKLTPVVDQRLHDATTNHSGMRIAFMVNDEVLTNVVWDGPYGMDLGGVRVSMSHGMAQARKLMKAIEGCTANRAP